MTALAPTLYRHDGIVGHRPFAFDIDGDGWLWEGVGADRLVGHNLRTAELRVHRLPQMEGRVVFAVFNFRGRLVLVLGECPFYLVVDPASGAAERRELPGPDPIVWYGTLVGDAAGQKLILFDRRNGRALLLDAPDAEPRVVPSPYEGDLAAGTLHGDGLVYAFLGDPARLVRFDPRAERFLDETPLPWPEVGVSGRVDFDGVLYGADSAGGRLLPLDMASRRWLDPIPVPDHGRVFGFIGLGFPCRGRAYYTISTYAARSRLDPKTGKLILPEGGLVTVDGRPPRFMERYLVFDPRTRGFEYLAAPEQPDGVPLLCYAWSDGERFAITGIVLPFEGDPAEKTAGPGPGPWIVLQSEPAADEPELGPFDFDYDRAAHVRRYRRSYPADRSLFLPEAPHTPPIVNMTGPATAFPPGRDQELGRRAARTDAKRYWADVARRLSPPGADDAARMRHILEHVHHHIYYNPIQVPQTFDPIAVHEAHDGRCGHGVAITRELCAAAGIESRTVGLTAHCVAEAFYDGSWHLADALFFGGEQPSRDGRVLSVDELRTDPYYADAWPQACFAYDPELLMSEDGYQVLGYVFGPWGSEPYYSYYMGAEKEHPPTMPTMLPAQRLGEREVLLRWSPAVKLRGGGGGGAVEYDVRVFADRACTQELWQAQTREASARFEAPEVNRMYYAQVCAMDGHRSKNPRTWYPASRWNFVVVPREHYGWYGVV